MTKMIWSLGFEDEQHSYGSVAAYVDRDNSLGFETQQGTVVLPSTLVHLFDRPDVENDVDIRIDRIDKATMGDLVR